MLNFLIKILRFIYRLRQISGIQNTCFTPGHFYSPIVSIKQVKRNESSIWQNSTNSVQGINLRSDKQIELINSFSDYYKDLPFAPQKNANRYYFENIFYGYTDAFVLYSFIRHYKPNKIIEAGSGFSSALMLDTREKYLHDLKLTFIEPYPKRLKSLLNQQDADAITIYQKVVQDIDIQLFEQLEANDIFFVDSTHVSKTGSDVNHIFFNILPRLKKGVLIHFHDIFYPFEYPKSWVYQGRSWNENYILKAFLMHNNDYEILFFSDYMHKCKPEAFRNMPLCYKNSGGSIWLRKLI